MIIRYQSICLIFALAIRCAAGSLSPAIVAEWERRLASSDAAVRTSAFLEIAKTEEASENVIHLVNRGLLDNDEDVRSAAAGCIAAIAYSASPKLPSPRRRSSIDIRNSTEIHDALLRAMDDPNEEIRRNALIAFICTFPVPESVQNTLVHRFDSVGESSPYRGAILWALTIDGKPSGEAKNLLLQLAAEPTQALHVAQAIKDSPNPPSEILPELVRQFSNATDVARIGMFLRAISRYGARAKPFVSTLEEAAGRQSDVATRRTLEAAVVEINNSP